MLQLAQHRAAEETDPRPALGTISARGDRRPFPNRSFIADDPTLAVVHDLRNPLAAISGCAELLASGKLDVEETRRVAANIWRASQQMKNILGGFVATAKGRH